MPTPTKRGPPVGAAKRSGKDSSGSDIEFLGAYSAGWGATIEG